MAFKEHTLKSGRMLEIGLANFRDSKKLFDAVLTEIKASKVDVSTEIDANFIKDCLLSVVSSENVEKALWPCLTKSLYQKVRITPETFEGREEREDYLEICYEVGKENIIPFGKNLYAELSPILGTLGLSLK